MSAPLRACALAVGVLMAVSVLAATPHLELDVTLDPGTRRMVAAAQFSAPRDARFALHRSFIVTRASVGGKAVAFEMTGTAAEQRIWRVAAAPPA